MPCLLKLPFELLLNIAESLLPDDDGALIEQNSEFTSTIAKDIERANKALDDLRNLALACRTLKYVCSKIYRGVRLVGGERQTGFLQDLNEVQSRIYGRNTRYLSLERPEICDTCRCQPFADHGHIATTKTLVSKFPSIRILDLCNHVISFDTIHALIPLKSLKTLSIRDPAPGGCVRLGTFNIRQNWPLPQLANLIISINDFRACPSARTALWCFEPMIRTLFIEGTRQSSPGTTRDFLGATDGIYLGFSLPQYPNLKRVSIGYLEFRPGSLRDFVSKVSGLESLTVDCRGVRGLIPLFYVIDLLREHTGDEEGWLDMTDYDDLGNNRLEDPEGPSPEPYIQDARIWRRSIAHFGCTFGVSGQTPGAMKWIKGLELEFASADDTSGPPNEDVRIEELIEVFDRRQASFAQLETLSIRMPKERRDFKLREQSIKETMTAIIGASLPSLKNCAVEWGDAAFRLAE